MDTGTRVYLLLVSDAAEMGKLRVLLRDERVVGRLLMLHPRVVEAACRRRWGAGELLLDRHLTTDASDR